MELSGVVTEERDPELRKPIKRKYEERKRPKIREVDAVERAFRIKRITLGVYAAAYVSLPVGVLVANDLIGPAVAVGMIVGVVAVVYVVTGLVSEGAGAVAAKIHAPSGESTPRRKEFSRAQSLVARGQYRDATVAYEVHCLEDPTNPDPYFRVAEIYHKHLSDPTEAVAWYQRARADADLTPGEELLAIQTVVEIYVHTLRTPRKAITELVQITKRFPGTEAADAARRELADMRSLLAEESEGLASFTTLFLEKLDARVLQQAATKSRAEMEREMITGALIETHNDRQAAAQQLGITLEALEAAMRQLDIR